MWWLINSKQILPEATGPYAAGCADVMLDYSKDGIFMRLFYPTNDKRTENYAPWIPHDSYIAGIASVIMNFTFFIRMFYYWIAKTIPVVYGAKPHCPPGTKLKCVILSHGLGGFRNLYTNFCCELASRGFLVAALEHRDHSACHTYYYNSPEAAASDLRTPIPYRVIELGKNHFNERKSQVELRALECCKALDFVLGVNRGRNYDNVINHARGDFQLGDLEGKIDEDCVTMAGHSFGGGTALLALSKRAEFKIGVLLDPWMFPVKDAGLPAKLSQPLIFVNTQTFHIASNVQAMGEFLTDEKKRKMFTILHTTHENQTDSALVAGYWLNWFMKKLDPLQALKINNSLILNFLSEFTGVPADRTDSDECLDKEKHNFVEGLTRPWA